MSRFDDVSFPAYDGLLLNETNEEKAAPRNDQNAQKSAFQQQSLPYWLPPQSCEQHWQWSRQYEPQDLYKKPKKKFKS